MTTTTKYAKLRLNTLAAATLATLLATTIANADGGLFGIGRNDADKEYWAIRCLSAAGPNRFTILDQYAEALKKVDKIKDRKVVVIHDDNESSLYYGKYERVYNSKTASHSYKPDPTKELNYIRNIYVQNTRLAENDVNNWPFRYATIARLPTGDSAHPEWDLTRAAGYWTLQVAVFYNSDQMTQRKAAAVQYCKVLRDQGHEAYYHHSNEKSSVCVGLFPRDAVRQVKETNKLTGLVHVSYKLADKRIDELQRKFPHNMENGHVVYEVRDGFGKRKKNAIPSFVVKCPKRSRALLARQDQSD